MGGAWDVASVDFVRLRGDGGLRFAQLLNALLRAEATASDVPASAVHLTERVNEADGGVDAVVDRPLNRPFGACHEGSFWQYKGATAAAVATSKLALELAKPEVQRRLSDGLQYVVCVCDDLPADKLREREHWLATEVGQTFPDAPRPRLLTLGHLITWLTAHPGVVASHLRTDMRGVRGHAGWLAEARALLPSYVPLLSRAGLATALQEFWEGSDTGASVWPLAGESGTGATRLVAESLRGFADNIVVVEPQEAMRVAYALVERDEARALLVVDRGSIRLREQLEDLLRGAASRIRAVLIHEPSEPVESANRLSAPAADEIEQILKQNFKSLGLDARRAVVRVADGVIKIGAHLARAAIGGQGSSWLHGRDAWAADQLTLLVGDVPQDVIILRAIALFGRVGMTGDVAVQLEDLAALFGLDKQLVRTRIHALARKGLAVVGPRYVTVRPHLFAKVCFNQAWGELIASQYPSWRSTLPPVLHSAFLRQAARFASEAARRAIAQVELRQLGQLAPIDLLQEPRAQSLLFLLEIDPVNVARRVADLIDGMTKEQLLAAGDRLENWNARQHWVHALRELLSRAETYALGESALFRLARAEAPPGSPGSGGSRQGDATESWLETYSVILSGTPIPFPVRAERLIRKLDADPDAAWWVIAAASRALDAHASKVVGSPLVAGDVRTPDWHPRTYGEWSDCRVHAMRLLGRCMGVPLFRSLAFAVFARFGWLLLGQGHLDHLRDVLDAAGLDSAERSQVRHFVGQFLKHEARQSAKAVEDGKVADQGDPKLREAYLARVREWSAELKPQDFLQGLIEALQSREDGDLDASGSFDELARAFMQQDFATVMGRLRPEGRHFYRLYDFGVSLGKQDVTASLLDGLLAPDTETPLLLARGYLEGLGHRQDHDERVRCSLDALEKEDPAWCLDLALCHPRAGLVCDRAFRLVRTGRLPLATLASVHAIRHRGERRTAALQLVLEDSADAGTRAEVALALCSQWADTDVALPDESDAQDQIWAVLELAATGDGGSAHTWGSLLARIAQSDAQRAARLACHVADDGEYFLAAQAASALRSLATTHAAVVVEAIGRALLEMEQWQVGLSKTVQVLSSMTDDVVFEWLSAQGLPAARAIAFHLPEPLLGADGVPTFPSRTERFLMLFGRDPEVIENFCNPPYRSGLYAGDIAAQHDQEAARARPFLNHEQPAVRRWAEREVEGGEHSAERWRAIDEERRGR